jgi:hypothetical protein
MSRHHLLPPLVLGEHFRSSLGGVACAGGCYNGDEMNALLREWIPRPIPASAITAGHLRGASPRRHRALVRAAIKRPRGRLRQGKKAQRLRPAVRRRHPALGFHPSNASFRFPNFDLKLTCTRCHRRALWPAVMRTAPKGRTHGCTDQPAGVKKVLANSEPSTHGTGTAGMSVVTESSWREAAE